MTHDDLDRRIQDELDGVATSEESAELKRRLQASPGARARYDEMKAVFRMLDRVEEVEPPPTLKERVILALPPAPAPRGRGALLGAFQRRPGLGWGYSFAAGLAAGVSLVLLVHGVQTPRSTPSQDARFSGSMAPLETRALEIVDWVRVELDGDHARAETRLSGSDVVVRIESGARNGEVLVQYDPNAFAPQSFERTGPASGSIELHPGRILIRAAGQGRHQFVLRPAGSARPPLQVSLVQEDKVAARTLRTGPARRE